VPTEPLAERVADHLATPVLTGAADETVERILERMTAVPVACLDAVYIVDPDGRLAGCVPLPSLLAAPRSARLGELAFGPPPAVDASADQEHAATLAHEHRLASVPVVDPDGRLLGVVPPQALIDVLRREHVEDLSRLAGIVHDTSAAREALLEPARARVRHRLPWLLVGLGGSVLATLVVSRFERALESTIAIAFFVPAIVYLADAIGTQTEAIAVRGLSLGPAPSRQAIARELGAGTMIGLVLGGIALPIVLLAFGNVRLALAVGLALVVAGAIATSIGLLFPLALSRLGFDPAYGSGPVATIVQDVLSLLTYFVTAELLL
jgi:magnesium transporter